ncbi:hypothetical protein STEG23_011106 [Scotinomys teguina]
MSGTLSARWRLVAVPYSPGTCDPPYSRVPPPKPLNYGSSLHLRSHNPNLSIAEDSGNFYLQRGENNTVGKQQSQDYSPGPSSAMVSQTGFNLDPAV